MKIDVICVGKIKEAYYRDAVAEYVKRLSRYCKLRILEMADEPTPDAASPAEEQQILEREGGRILKCIAPGAYVIVLAIQGKEMDSVALSRKLESLGVEGVGHIQLIIGGSLGLAPAVLQAADLKLSFSPMTFPHQLMRVILLEQIYRAYRIMNHEPYHK